MTRRERLEARAEKRRTWAAGRERKATAAFNRARGLTDGIPFGQPILVGHHSEKRHRRTLEKADNAMRAMCESSDMAKHHASKADGLDFQLERSIFSDDPDAVEALEAKAAAIDADADRCKAINAAFRKAPGADFAAKLATLVPAALAGPEALQLARSHALAPYHAQPFPAYHLSLLRANARRCRERIKDVQRRQARTAAAEAAPNGVTIARHPDYDACSVCFAEKPERSILEALRAAHFYWSGGTWSGSTSNLPACVLELEGGAS